MMLSTMIQIESVIRKFTNSYKFSNDENLNIVLECVMSDESFDLMENEIERLLPLNIFTTREEMSSGHFLLRFKEVETCLV